MPTKELSEISPSHAVVPAKPFSVWSDPAVDAPAVDVRGIVEGLGMLLTAMAMMSSDLWD
jgi:hypothetical protein